MATQSLKEYLYITFTNFTNWKKCKSFRDFNSSLYNIFWDNFKNRDFRVLFKANFIEKLLIFERMDWPKYAYIWFFKPINEKSLENILKVHRMDTNLEHIKLT